MALLGTYIEVATLSMAARSMGCVAHSLNTTPDWVSWMGNLTLAGTVSNVSTFAARIQLWNEGGSAVGGQVIAAMFHSIIR